MKERYRLSSCVGTPFVTARASSLPRHQETTDEVNVIRQIPVLQHVLHGFQDYARVIIRGDHRQMKLRDDEISGEET